MNPEDPQMQLEKFVPLLSQMLLSKRALTAAPTFTPRNSFEQIQLYDDGAGDLRLYIYLSAAWHYVTLT